MEDPIQNDLEQALLSSTQAEPKPVRRYGLWRMYRDFATAQDWAMLMVGLACGITNAYLMPYQTELLGEVFSGASGVDHHVLYDNIMQTTPLMLYLGVTAFALAYVQYITFIIAGSNVLRRFKFAVLTALLEEEVSFFDVSSPGQLAARLSEKGGALQVGSGEAMVDCVFWLFRFFFGYWIAFNKNWQVALAMTLTLPANSGSIGCMIYYIIKNAKRMFKASEEAAGIAQETFSGIQTIQSFGGAIYKRMELRYEEKLMDSQTHAERLSRVVGCGMGMIYFTIFLSFGIGYWFGSFQIEDGVNFGSILTAITACIIGSISIGVAFPNLSAAVQASVAAQDLYQLMSRTPKQPSSKPMLNPQQPLKGFIEFRDVSFVYPSRKEVPCLGGVTFAVDPGQTCALVGGSGAGKSTIFALLKQFYVVDSGEILLDGRDISTYDRDFIKRSISYVAQQPVMFRGTIYSNLCFAKEGASMKEVIAAAKLANAHEFIKRFPDGYFTHLSGTNLSGGEKQRLAIARALLVNPSILLLDEATSALDNASQKVVQQAIDEVLSRRNKTTLIIAHRLSTVMNADKIIVIRNDGGGAKVVEEGSHADLSSRPQGVYRRLFELQNTSASASESQSSWWNRLFSRVAPASVGSTESREPPSLPPIDSLSKPKPTLVQEGLIRRLARLAEGEYKWYLSGTIGSAIKGATQPLLSIIMSTLLVRYVLIPLPYSGFPLPCQSSITCPHNELCRPLHLPEGYPTGSICVNPCQSPAECRLGDTCSDFRPLGFLDGKYCSSGYADSHGPDDVRTAGNEALLWYLLIGILTGVGVCLQMLSFKVVGYRLGTQIKQVAFKSAIRQDGQFFDDERHSVGSLVARVSSDAVVVRELIGDMLGVVTENVVAVSVALVIALLASWEMTVVVFVPMMAMMYTEYFQHKRMREIAKLQITGVADAGHIVSESIDNIRTVKAFESGMAQIKQQYSLELQAESKANISRGIWFSLSAALSQLLYFLAYAISFLWGGRLLNAGRLDPENLSKVLFTLSLTATFFGQSAAQIGGWAKAQTTLEGIFELFDSRPAVDPDDDTTGDKLKPLRGDIRLENVSFSYPSRPNILALNRVSATIKAGETVAFVGVTGCGKSTIIKLLERFYELSLPEAVIRLDGYDIRQLNLKWMRAQIGLCSQEPLLFEGSILYNVSIGADHATKDEVEAACRDANAHDFITNDLSDGYLTECGAKGVQLSGGQKQRIALARALIKRPRILLLDEATSALDAESELVVQEALDKAIERRERTIIVIAHRLSTVRNADKIFVLKNTGNGGTIVESGSHDELMKVTNGHYRNLYEESPRS